MKRLLFFLLLIPCFLAAQNVTTQDSRNRVKNFTGTASTDSVSTTANVVRFLVNVIVNTSVASDTIIIKQGAGVVGQIIIGSTILGAPSQAFYNCRIDSPYVTVQRKKTSDVTLIWRDRP